MKVFIFVIAIIANSFIGIAQEIIEPVFDSCDVAEFHVEKVEITKDTTYIYCFYKAEAGSWARISKDMYLEDVNDGTKFPLLRASGLPYAPMRRDFANDETIQVILYFPHINTNKFNIIEDGSESVFNVYGVNLSECNHTRYDESDYKRFYNLSDFYQSANNEAKFLEFEEKELQAAQYLYGLKSPFAWICYQRLSEIYELMGDYSKAIDFELQVLECDSILYGVENPEYPVYPNSLYMLSSLYEDAGNVDEALQCEQKAIGIWRNMRNAENYLNEIYRLLLDGHDKLSIARRVEMAKKEMDALPNFVDAQSSLIASIYGQMANNYLIYMDDAITAINYCDKAIITLSDTKSVSVEKYAKILSLKSTCLKVIGNINDAITTGEAAKQIYDSLAISTLDYASLLCDLSFLFSENYDYEKAIFLEEKAANIYKENEEWNLLARSYNQLCYYYQNTYNLEKAKFYIKKAIGLLEKYDDAVKFIQNKAQMIDNPYYNNPYTTTLHKQEIDKDNIHFYETLAGIYEKEGDITEAIKVEEKVGLIINKQGKEHSIYNARHLITLSRYYLIDKQYENALKYAMQSGQYLKECGKDLTSQKEMLSMIYGYWGYYEKAIQYGNESLKLIGNDINGRTSLLSALGFLYYKNHNLSKSEEIISELLDSVKSVLCNVGKMTNEQRQRLWNKYEHNFLLYRNVVKELDNNEAYLSKLYDYVLFSKSFMLYTGISQNSDYLSRLNNTWKDIQNVLSEDDIAIEFIATTHEDHEGYTYNAMVVDKHCQNPQMIELYSDFDTINTLGEKVWASILNKYKNARNIYFSADYFFHTFPIEYLIVDGYGLMFEKFNMYRLSSTKEILQKKGKNKQGQAVLYGGLEYNQMADFALEEKTGTMPSLLRGISERGGFEPLYNTLDEVNNIRNLLSSQNIATTLYVGNEGTEESFRKISGMNVHILHLATHGMYIEPENVSLERHRQNFDFMESLNNEKNPVKEDVTLTHSFLVLSGGNKLIQHNKVLGDDDGILTAKEILIAMVFADYSVDLRKPGSTQYS